MKLCLHYFLVFTLGLVLVSCSGKEAREGEDIGVDEFSSDATAEPDSTENTSQQAESQKDEFADFDETPVANCHSR
jgi:hypothetical protein